MADRGADVSGRRGAARRRARKAPPAASGHLVGPARRAAARALLRRRTDDLPIYLPRRHPLLQQRDCHGAAVYGTGAHFTLGVPACAPPADAARGRCARARAPRRFFACDPWQLDRARALAAGALLGPVRGGVADALYAPAGRSASALSRERLHGLRDVHRRRGAARAHAGVADPGRAQRRGGARHAGDLRCRHGACIHALSAGRERRRRRARKPARLHRAGQRGAVCGALAAHELRVAGSSRLCCHSGDGSAHRAARARVGKSTEKAEN